MLDYGFIGNIAEPWRVNLSIKLVERVNGLNHERIILFMRFVLLTSISYSTLFIALVVSLLFIDFAGLPSIITENLIEIIIFGSLVFALGISMLQFFSKDSQLTTVIEFGEIDGIPSSTKLLEYYAVLLPCFLVCIGFTLAITIPNAQVRIFGQILWVLGLILYLILPPMKVHNLYYTFSRAKDIFDNYIRKDKENRCVLYEFTNYFEKSINNIDRELPNGVKIDDLKKSSKGSMKNTIIHYLPIYIKYAKESDIKAMQKHINKMSELTDKNSSNIRSLEIVSPILDIYKETEIFLGSNHYSIQSQSRRRIITCFTSACLRTAIVLALLVSAIMIVLVLSNNASLTIDPLYNSLNVPAQLVEKEDWAIVATCVSAAIIIFEKFYFLFKRNI